METKHSQMRKAFTMIELIFVLVIVVGLIIMGTNQYQKAKAPTDAIGEFGTVSHLIRAVESAAGEDSNQYPALASLNIAGSDNTISNQMGGAAKVADLAGWTYDCTAGTSSTVTITSKTYNSAILADLVRSKIRGAFPQWAINASGNTQIVLTMSGVVCK